MILDYNFSREKKEMCISYIDETGNKQLLHKPKELMRPLLVSQCSYSRDQSSLVFASTTPPVELSFDPLMLRVCLPYS